MEITEIIKAKGHKNVRATHKTTFEITKERNITPRGDCIIAVSADKALKDLNTEFKQALRNQKAKLTIIIQAGEIFEIVKASGDEKLTLSHPTSMVIRKSSYICNRTLAIKANKAAIDLSRKLIKELQNPNQTVEIKLKVEI